MNTQDMNAHGKKSNDATRPLDSVTGSDLNPSRHNAWLGAHSTNAPKRRKVNEIESDSKTQRLLHFIMKDSRQHDNNDFVVCYCNMVGTPMVVTPSSFAACATPIESRTMLSNFDIASNRADVSAMFQLLLNHNYIGKPPQPEHSAVTTDDLYVSLNAANPAHWRQFVALAPAYFCFQVILHRDSFPPQPRVIAVRKPKGHPKYIILPGDGSNIPIVVHDEKNAFFEESGYLDLIRTLQAHLGDTNVLVTQPQEPSIFVPKRILSGNGDEPWDLMSSEDLEEFFDPITVSEEEDNGHRLRYFDKVKIQVVDLSKDQRTNVVTGQMRVLQPPLESFGTLIAQFTIPE